MLITGPSIEPLPLRGYDIYADDIPVIARHVGKECTLLYWQHGREAGMHETDDFSRLTRPDVAGFLIAGDFVLKLELDPTPTRKSRCRVTAQAAGDMDTVLNAIAAMRARRVALNPWRAYDCRFIPRPHSEHKMRMWVIAGVVGTLIAAVATVLALAL